MSERPDDDDDMDYRFEVMHRPTGNWLFWAATEAECREYAERFGDPTGLVIYDNCEKAVVHRYHGPLVAP